MKRKFLTLCFTLGLLHACAGSSVQSEKMPGTDLWMYHIYSWIPHESNEQQPEISKLAKKRVDFDLSEQGMIRVSDSGNPDYWVRQVITPHDLSIEFIDAHTGTTYWKGQAAFETRGEQLTQNKMNSAVDGLMNKYVAAQEWMSATFWWTGNQ